MLRTLLPPRAFNGSVICLPSGCALSVLPGRVGSVFASMCIAGWVLFQVPRPPGSCPSRQVRTSIRCLRGTPCPLERRFVGLAVRWLSVYHRSCTFVPDACNNAPSFHIFHARSVLAAGFAEPRLLQFFLRKRYRFQHPFRLLSSRFVSPDHPFWCASRAHWHLYRFTCHLFLPSDE